MPDKRKNNATDDRNSKKVRTSDFSSFLPTVYSSDDDSDGDLSTLPAFDLPNFDLFTDGGQGNDLQANGSKDQSDGGIIFLSDLSQLPKPINFNMPTVMNSVVIGAGPQKTHSQVLVMNKPVNSGNKSSPQLQPVILTPAQMQPRAQTANRMSYNNAVGGSPNSHVSIPATKIVTAGGAPSRPPTSRRNKPSAQSHITTLPANMSATNIMKHVMAAAQQAAKNIRAAATQVRPTQKTTPTAPTQRRVTNLVTGDHTGQNVGQNGHSLVNGSARQNVKSEPTKRWKPYSDILNDVVKKLSRDQARKLGINPSLPLNLKQMHNLLRNKFNTQQIYDMCLWDMEHPDASLLEIAITNAFT